VNAPMAREDVVADSKVLTGPQERWRQAAAPKKPADLRVYQHSNLAYWWVVWVYGFLCAGVTYAQGIGIRELATRSEGVDKVILFHPSPWLGLSFIGLILFVIIFTNVRARGVYSIVLLLHHLPHRPFHLVAFLAGPGDRGAPRGAGHGARVQYGGHDHPAAAGRPVPASGVKNQTDISRIEKVR
jgi:hypothetical protein